MLGSPVCSMPFPTPISSPPLELRYSLGEAIAFGDGFVHATQTGTSPRPLCFLCFTFGEAGISVEQWQRASEYISQQGPVYQDPWGHLVTSPAFESSTSTKGKKAERQHGGANRMR